MAAFDVWAEYYDLIHTGMPGDVEFYVDHATRARGGVLELGVGTGRVAIPSVLAGADVTGLDNSYAMLVLCREKLRLAAPVRGNLSLVLGDMTSFRFNGTFSCIMMPYRTFMHLLTQEEQRRCLDTVRAHLAEDGRVVMNTWEPKPLTLSRIGCGPTSGKLKFAARYRLDDGALTVLHFHAASCDEPNQLLIEQHVIHEVGGDGKIMREAVLPLVRAWTTRREIEYLFRLCGLEVEALYGDFRRGPFTDESTEMIYVLRKVRGS
jgi:SAM-dependent methyltransferase